MVDREENLVHVLRCVKSVRIQCKRKKSVTLKPQNGNYSKHESTKAEHGGSREGPTA